MDDYARMITGQYDANSREVNSPANQGIVFLDTDAIVTRVYAKLYLPREDFEQLEPLFKKTIAGNIELFIVKTANAVIVAQSYMNYLVHKHEVKLPVAQRIKKIR